MPKTRDVIKEIEADGWYLVNIEGSHRQYRHPFKKGKVTINLHPSMHMDAKLYAYIRKQAQL
jgi:predicted RNA binding protein YcfA (HicA-like mRNA interferase family)